ncbi:MAG: sulfotransferase family 2 domain-containing protein [Pseudomonadota bacterium]
MANSTPFKTQILEKQVIFVHVPKAAGTSLKTAIYGERRVGGHRSIAEFAAFDADRTKRFYKCCFVRNPWDRLFSTYSFLVQGRETNKRDRQFARTYLDTDFENFVKRLQDANFRRSVIAYDHFRPQTHWICMPGSKTHMMDFVGRFENIQADTQILFSNLGVPDNRLQRVRSSNHEDYRNVYSAATRNIVQDVYRQDVELLDYQF